MKNILITLLCAAAFSACSKSDKGPGNIAPEDTVGYWLEEIPTSKVGGTRNSIAVPVGPIIGGETEVPIVADDDYIHSSLLNISPNGIMKRAYGISLKSNGFEYEDYATTVVMADYTMNTLNWVHMIGTSKKVIGSDGSEQQDTESEMTFSIGQNYRLIVSEDKKTLTITCDYVDHETGALTEKNATCFTYNSVSEQAVKLIEKNALEKLKKPN